MSNILDEATGHKVAGLTIDAMQKLRSGKLLIEHYEKFLALSTADRNKLFGTPVVADRILKNISGSEVLTLDACDGQQTIHSSKNIFESINREFKTWGANEKGPVTPETAIDVYEMEKDATFAQFFGSMSSDVNTLCLTQSQILNFVVKHRNMLRNHGYGTFFFFKSNNELFVANVRFRDVGSLEVHVFRFEGADVWDASGAFCLVVPQLTT